MGANLDRVKVTRPLLTVHAPCDAGLAAAILREVSEAFMATGCEAPYVRPQFAGEGAGFTIMVTEMVDGDDPRAGGIIYIPHDEFPDGDGARGPGVHDDHPNLTRAWNGHDHPPHLACGEHCPLREA